MKLAPVLALAAIALLSAFKPALKSETFIIDTKASSIAWHAEKVTGKHNGTIKLASGTLVFNGSILQGGSFITDMKTISVSDLEGEYKQKLEGHLNSEDFFGTVKYGTSNFNITKVTATGVNQVTIAGTLTIKGITKPLSFPATVKREKNTVVAVAQNVKIDRTQYDIRYNSKSFFASIGDKAISDEFTLSINLVAKK